MTTQTQTSITAEKQQNCAYCGKPISQDDLTIARIRRLNAWHTTYLDGPQAFHLSTLCASKAQLSAEG